MSWTRLLLRAKSRALAIHLGISAILFLPFLALILLKWFPPPLFLTDGGWQGVRIMLAVDMVLGPTLTFLIYNPAKARRALLFDFSCIGLAQAAALAYGAYSVMQERVIAVAYDQGAFHAVPSRAFREQTIDAGSWASLGHGAPYWVYVREPRAADEASGVAAFAFLKGLERYALQFLYEPLSAHRDDVRKAALSAGQLAQYGAGIKADFERIAAGGKTVFAVPLNGYYRVAILVFDDQLRLVATLYPAPR